MRRYRTDLFYLFPQVLLVLLFANWCFMPFDRNKNPEKSRKFSSPEISNRVESVLSDLKAPGEPDMAAMQNFLMTMDPALGRVPVERLINAYYKVREWEKNNPDSKDALIWQSISADIGGRTRALVFDPFDPSGNKVWAGGVTGGLWYNNNITDGSSAWTPVNDFWPSLSVSSILFDPLEPGTLYIGTGEAQTAVNMYRESSGVGIGIWKTTDGGDTWNILSSTENFRYITDLAARIESGNTVIYAGVMSGIYHGIPHPSIPGDGLYRSADGGESWQQVLPDIPGENEPYAPADIEITASGRIFAGSAKNLEGKGGSVILYSDSGLPGSWVVYDDYIAIIQSDPVYFLTDRVVLKSAPSDPDVVYALLGAGNYSASGFNFSFGRYILRSGDGGQSWIQKNIPDNDPEWATLAWHALAAGVDPGDPNRLFIGGKDVYRSTNAGVSWNRVSDWTLMYSGGGDEYVHCDQHTQLFWPGSSDHTLFSNDGGVFYTTNAQQTQPVFMERNKGYNTLQFYTCDLFPLSGVNYIVGGLQDNGTLLYTGDNLNVGDMIDIGDGAYCFFDKDEPSVMITSHYYNRYRIFVNWEEVAYIDDFYSGVFISAADYDSEINTLYANAVMFNGNNAGKLLRISGIPYSASGGYVDLNTGINGYYTCIKYSPFSPAGTSTLYIGSQDGRLFRVLNAQSVPMVEEIGDPDFPSAYLSSIAIGGSEDTLMATFSNYGVQKIWQSYNGGQSWQDVSGNLPDMPVRWAIYHPENSRQAMIATELGIWQSANLHAEDVLWQPEINGMANVRTDMLRVRESDNTVVAATHGRGLFITNWERLNEPHADFTADNTAINTGQSVIFNDLSTGNAETWAWFFENGIPATSSQQNPEPIFYNTAGYHNVTLVVGNAAGSDTMVKTDYIYVESLTSVFESKETGLSYDPFTGKLIIRSWDRDLSDGKLRFFDTNGIIVNEQHISVPGNSEKTIPIPMDKPGIYIVEFSTALVKKYLKIAAVK